MVELDDGVARRAARPAPDLGGQAEAALLRAIAGRLAGGAVAPAELLRALLVSLAQSLGGVGLAAVRLGDLAVVVQAEVERVEPALAGQQVERLLERPGALHVAGGPVRPGGVGVDVGVVLLRLDVRALVDFLQGGGGAAPGRVGAHRGDILHVEGGEGAVLFAAGLDGHDVVRTVAHRVGLFLAVEDRLHGPAQPPGGQRRQHGVLVEPELRAEAAAAVQADDPDVGDGDVEGAGQGLAVGMDGLGGVPDGELVAPPLGHTAMGFQARVHLAGRAVGFLHHEVGLGEALFEVAPAVVADAAAHQVAFLMDLRGVFPEGGLGVEDEGQLFVVNLDELEGVVGGVLVHGHHGGHFLAHVAQGGAEQL